MLVELHLEIHARFDKHSNASEVIQSRAEAERVRWMWAESTEWATFGS